MLSIRPLVVLLSLVAVAGCDSSGPFAVSGDLIVTYVSDAQGDRVVLETADALTCPPPLAVRTREREGGVRIVVEGLDGPLGPCDQQTWTRAEVPVRVVLGSYDIEIEHEGEIDLYRATNGVTFSFEAVRTSVTRLGPR